jgi:hypothetical protein
VQRLSSAFEATGHEKSHIPEDGTIRFPRLLIDAAGKCVRIDLSLADYTPPPRYEILASPDHLARFAMAGQPPKSILPITVNSVFFQCSRAVIRAGLWKQESIVTRDSPPNTGAILRTLSQATIDGDAYDRALPQRIADTLY